MDDERVMGLEGLSSSSESVLVGGGGVAVVLVAAVVENFDCDFDFDDREEG